MVYNIITTGNIRHGNKGCVSCVLQKNAVIRNNNCNVNKKLVLFFCKHWWFLLILLSLLPLGELNGVDQIVVTQTQFSPLPEVLCMIVSELEEQRGSTTFDALMEALKSRYRGMHQPAEQLVYEALGVLVQEHKLYHTGKSTGYVNYG